MRKDMEISMYMNYMTEIGYQGGCPVFCFYKNVVREFLASDEFVVVCMHQLCECDDQLADCERDVRRW